MFKFFSRLIWRFKNRKFLKQLRECCKFQKLQETMQRTDLSYNDYLRENWR